MQDVENLDIRTCAGSGFASTIKLFPMAMLPGWLFAPSKTPGAWFRPDRLNPIF
jgi:hypothetical protein